MLSLVPFYIEVKKKNIQGGIVMESRLKSGLHRVKLGVRVGTKSGQSVLGRSKSGRSRQSID